MSTDELHRSVVKVLEQVLQEDLPEATADSRLFEDLDLDSMDVIELLAKLEAELEIVFDLERLGLENLHSLGAVVEFIRSEIAAGGIGSTVPVSRPATSPLE